MKNFFDDEFASEEAKAGSPLDVLFSDIDIDKVLSSAPMFGGTYAQTLARKKSDEVKTPEQAPSLFERFFKREKEPDAYGGITPYAVFPERKNNVAPALPDPVWEMESALRAEAARRVEELKAKAEAERKLQAAFDAGERQRREKSGMGLYIPESADIASSGTLPDEKAVRRVPANAVAEVVEKDIELPPDRSLLEKMADPQWQYEMERNIARIKEAEAIGAKRDDGKKEPTSGREEAKRSYAGPNAPLDLSGLEKDPAHFGKAIRNIIPMYADSMSKSTLVSAFEKEQAMQAKGAENIFKETDAYLRTRRPTEEDIARIKSEPAVPFSLEGGRQSGLTDVEAAMLMQADVAERKGDFEKAKRLREEVAKHVVDIAERADALAKWSEENRVQYERPAGYWHNAILNTIESSGHTIGSAIRSGAAWALGGPVAGLVMSFVNTGMEAESEAGQALHRMIEKGDKSPEEMRRAVEAARGRNIALLSLTNPLGDWLLFGTGKIASSVAEAIPGKTMLAKTMREAVQRIFPFVASGAPEAVEEMGQTYITSLATGDPLKENELRDSAVQGALGSVIYGGVGKAARSVVNFTKESLAKGKSSTVTESFLAGVVLSQRGKSFMENAEAVAKFNNVDGVDKLEIALMPEELQRDYFLLQRAQELIEEGKYTEATDLMTGKIRGEDADALIFTPKALAFKALSETKVRLDKEEAAESEYGVLDVADAFMEEKDYDGALRVLNAYNGKGVDAPVSAVEEAKAEEVKTAPVEAEIVKETPVRDVEVVSSTPVASAPAASPAETPAPSSWWQSDEIVDAERALVKARVKRDLIAAGTSEEVAEAQSAVMAQGVVASARREENPDLSPLAWYEKFGPSVGMGEAPAAKVPVVKEEAAPVSVEVAPKQESAPPVVEAPAPKGSLVDNGVHSFVDVASIAPAGDRASFDQDKIEAMADEMLRVGALPEPLLVRRTGGESFEVVGDGLRYWAAVRAREKNPRLGEMTSALIVTGDAAAFEKQREMLGGKNVVARELIHPDGFIIDERGQGLVDLKSITPRTKREAFDSAQVEALADSILELGGLVRPLAVKRTGPESFKTVGDDLAYWAAVRAKEKNPRFETVNSFIYTPSQARENAPVSVESVSEEQTPYIDEPVQQEAVVAPSPLLDRILAEPTINKRLEIIDGATKEELVSALASRGKEFKPNAGAGMLRSHLKRAVVLEGMKAADVQKFAKQNGLKVGKMKKGDVSNAVLDMVAPRRSEDVDANPFGVKAIVVDPRKGTGLEAVVEAIAPELRKGNINGKRIMLREDVLALQFEPGETVLTSTGRETTPYPKIDVSTNGKRVNSLKRFDSWLITNAIAEAEARGDNMNARVFEGDVDRVGKLHSATRDMAESYLFDPAFVFERQRPFLKPLVEATETPVDASVKMDTQDGVESEQSESAKKAWRVRRDDWVDGRYRSPGMHRYAVQQALEKGENVPAEVLSDYPEFMTSKIQIPELIDKGVELSNEEVGVNDGTGDDAGNAGLLAEGVPEGVQADVEGRGVEAGESMRESDADGDGRVEAGESEADGRDGVVGVEAPVLHDAAAGGAGTDSQGLGTGSDNRGVSDSAMEVGDASEGSLPGDGSGPAQEVAAILSETESGRGASGRGVIQAKDRKKTSDGTVVEIAGENPGNFVIGPDFALGEGTDASKIQRNIDALRVLKRVKNENRFPTREEQAVMARYVGWGGLKNVFDPARAESNDMFGKAQRALRELLTTEEYNDAAMSIQNAHYTAKGVVEAMWRLARHFGFKGGRVLEPTVGVGNFLGLQPEDMAAASEWHASELDTVSGEIAAMLYPNAHVLASTGFEDAAFADGAFDLAIGNPPFGDMPIIRGLKKSLHGMKIHNYIIAKSGDHLRPGGVMMMVVTHRFLDTANPEARSHLAKRFKFLGAVRLPNDAFKKNAGTEVVTDIIMLQKLRPGEEADMSAAWLDVNGSIDVDGSAVRVNKYYEEHPSHILGRSATDGKMYARGAGNEYTVHSDGRDVAKAIDDLITTDFVNLSGVMTPTNADLNLGAAMLERSSLAIGSLLLDNNGKILRRDMDDAAGNAVIEEITAETLWKDQAKEWEALVDVLTDIRDRNVKGDVYDLIEPYAAVAYKAKGGEKGDATQADKAVYAIVNAAKEGDFEWRFDYELKKIDEAYRRRQLGEDGLARLKGMLDLRNRVLSLNAAERADAPNIETLRKELNKAYDAFVKKFGYVNSANNFKLLEGDIGPEVGLESSYSKGMSKAVAKKAGFDDAVPDKATKADILSKRVNYPDSEIESADSSEDALKISLSQRGRVDAPYMAQLTGKPIEDVLRELTAGETPFLFLNSETNEYEHADEFLSGNVKKKLQQAIAAGDERAAEALRKVQPEPKSAERITPSIRSAWIPESVFVEFLTALGVQGARVNILPSVGLISAQGRGESVRDLGIIYSTPHRTLVDLFNSAASGKSITITHRVGEQTVVDKAATEQVNALAKKMGEDFKMWAYSSEERKQVIVDAFNEKMNTHVDRKYDGVAYLNPVGVTPSLKLRNVQKNAAWRMIQSKTMLHDHVVGLGKTFSNIVGVMERKRLGLSKKPLVVVPNHLVTQWAADFYKVYPNAKILAATPADFSKKNRRRLFARMATGDFDAIIIGHSSFQFIPAAEADTALVVQEQIDQLRDAIEQARGTGEGETKGDKRTLAMIQKKLQSYENRLVKMNEKRAEKADKMGNEEHGIDFESLGIDYLVVDEAHEFKNLEYNTMSDRVIGMNSPDGSQKAFDLYVKIRGMLERGGAVSFATGTPVSNSLVEIYTMMKYLAHDELRDRGQLFYDAWAGAYVETEMRAEYTPAQTLVMRNVLSGLSNLSGLQQIYKQFADTVTMEQLKSLYREEVEERNKLLGQNERTEFPVPKVKDGGRRLLTLPATPVQAEVNEWLVARLEAIRTGGKEYRSRDNVLNVMTDARKAALDIRILDPKMPREETGKVVTASREIKRIYDEWNDVRGAQFVFCDLSTPTKYAAANAKKLLRDAMKIVFGDKGIPAFVKEAGKGGFEATWKAALETVNEKFESGDVSDAIKDEFYEFLEENDDAEAVMITADVGFSVYDDLKAMLRESGIPESEIAFIHDYNTPEQKKELFNKVNRGIIRVLIGSSAKMGAGMNAQERAVALHHLDAPWRPSDMEQREGRIIRQENSLYAANPDGFEVEIIAYSAQASNDAVMWQILERKAKAIEQFRSGGDVDSIVEGSSDADQYADFMASSTGNPVYKQELEARKVLSDAETSVVGRLTARSNAEHFLKLYSLDQKELLQKIKNLGELDASHEDFAKGKELLDGLDDEYRTARAKYEAKRAEIEKAIAKWNDTPKESRGKKPEMPNAPKIVTVLRDEIVDALPYARRVKEAMEQFFSTTQPQTVSMGDGVTIRLSVKLDVGVPQWWADVYVGEDKVSSVVKSVIDPRNSPEFMKSFDPRIILDSARRAASRAKFDLSKLEEKKTESERIMGTTVSLEERKNAEAVWKWYKLRVSLAEAETAAARGDKENRFITADRRPLRQRKGGQREESRTIEINGEEYQTSGIWGTQSTYADVGAIHDAVRVSDNLPVILSSDEKRGFYVVMEQPASLREGAEETLYQMGDTDADYLAAVEAGDMETAQRMVDEAAKEAGYSYHRYTKGSPSGDIPWMMFTVDKESVENAYGNNYYVASDRDAIDIEDLIPDIAEALEEYGSTEFIRDNAEAIADELNPDEIVTSAGSWDDADVVQDVWDRVLEDRGILKVKTTNGLIVMAEQDSDGNPLVKSADPVVKDNKGNVIPLSERFDKSRDDIRYRLASRPVEGTLQIYDEEFSDAGSLVEGVKRGDLLVHARRWGEIDLVELEYGLEPTIGKTLGDTEAAREAAELGIPVPPLVFASDSLNWIGGDRDGVVFLRKDGFQKSLGDGRVELPDGRIVPYERSPLADYESDSLRSEPVGVEKGDWYTTKTAEVAGVAQWRSGENVAYRLAENRDADYLSAVEAGDMETAQRMVYDAAEKAGYFGDSDYRMDHQAPNSRDDVSLANLRESGLVPDDYWTNPEWYQTSNEEMDAWHAVKSAMRGMDARASKGKDPGSQTLFVYRAVPKGIKEGAVRNGDWVTPSREYATQEGLSIPEGYRIISQRVKAKDLYWDGNSIAEFGYDDGETYAYRDTKNNRKLLDPVTYDDSGNVIPLSERFDSGKDDVRYQRRLTPKSGSYRDNLKKDAAAFAVAVDDTVSGKGQPDSYVNVMTTPLVLSLVGADVLPVQMRRQKLLDVMNKHGLSSEVLKKIPAALADPIMVFKSDLKAKGESLVVMLDLTDDDGATIIAALHLDVVPGRNMYAMNRLASVYGKKDAVENRDAWFVEQMEKGNAKYINKKKSSQWFGRASFFFTGGANLESFITQSVATEADLVKLRNAYPGYYQGEGAEAKGSITFRRGTDARPEIRLFENADASTFMHEAMHFFVDDLLRQMNTGKPSDETRALYRQLNNVANVTRDKNKNLILAEKEHEKLAAGFEAYLERGVAPKGAKGLQGVFEKFKQWLKELFSFARSNNVEMSDALVSLYDTMLTTPEERAAAESELAESANVEESVETIEAAEVEADVNEGVETIEAEVMAEDETVDFASPEGEKELAGQPRAWEAPRPSTNPKARALGLSKIRDLVKRLVPWRFGNTEGRTGVYSEREKLIKTKDDYDFPTAMHEVGHHLMKEMKLNTGLPKGTLKELESLGRQTARPGAAQDVVLAEGVAQFVQYYIINKAAAKAAAPVFFVEFESRLDKADAKLIEDFGDLRDAVSAFYESSPESRVLAHVRSAGEKRPYSKTLVSSRLKRDIFRTYEGLVDDKHSWNVLTEWIKKTPEGKEEMKNNGGFLPDRLDFYAQVSTLAGYMKQADKDVEGMMNLVGKLTKKEYDQLTAYAVSLQSIEYYDNDMNPGTGPRSDHEAVVANTPQHIKDVLKGVQDIYNNMVKETLLDTGVISQEGFDAMRTKWENYVPFMRDLDEDGFIDWLTKGAPKNGANLRSYVDVRNPFMKRYGVAEHERTEIFDPFEVMIHNAVVFHGIKSRNDFAKLVVDAANSLKGFGWLASKSEAMSKADMKEHAVFYVWRDGQKEYYSTDPELYVLLKGMYDSGNKAGNPFIRGALSWMQFAADVFKMGTTRYNPAFMLLNFLRDAQGTAIQSEGWAMPFVATIKGLMLQLSNDPKHEQLIEDAINDGVFYSAITSLPKGTSIEAIAKELRRQRALASSTGIARTLRNLMETPRSVGGWVGRANEMVEMAPKLYEYEYLRRTKPKMGGKRAAMKARSVNIDFGRAGTWGRGFNSVTAFFNAGVQGLDKVREVSKQRPMQTFAKVMLYQVLPSVLMRLAILSNPDDEEKYQRIAPGMRDTHFFIPVQNETLGMNVWTRLPKADNWWIISAVFERMITEAAKKDPEAWRGFADSVVNLLPPYVPTMIAPIIQVWRNTDTFTDRPIVSKRYEHQPDELQFHTGTSETAKLLGKVTKTSPIMLEFMYDKHVGEVGAQVLSLAEWTFDMVGAGMGLVDEKTKMEAGKASDLPFFKRFFYDTTRTGEPLNRFYSYHDQLLDDKKRADAAGTTFENERLLKAFNRTRAKLTDINREKDDIRLDPDLSRKDKRELIDMLENRAAEYAKAAMAVYYESKGVE